MSRGTIVSPVPCTVPEARRIVALLAKDSWYDGGSTGAGRFVPGIVLLLEIHCTLIVFRQSILDALRACP